MGAKISNWSLSRDCGHMFVKIPPQFSVADFVRQAKGENGGAKLDHGSGGEVLLRAA